MPHLTLTGLSEESPHEAVLYSHMPHLTLPSVAPFLSRTGAAAPQLARGAGWHALQGQGGASLRAEGWAGLVRS